ncbi:MAG: DUF3748 domain-containing protein [Sphingobacterium sp.]|uniref:DUF3748 domain-containing protein n=1 Tax=Sphingobacterium sp. JB170 TaxID=1434842 RepID=UPI001C4EDFC6|nr:DUF3748 domain-containing protein [Sphingobacterium sp. JB170]
MKQNTVTTLSHSSQGHTLHHNRVFSKDGQWLVFDGRNDDTKIGETSVIGTINVKTGEERTLYRTNNSTVYGPGVGAASFNPLTDRVVFIHGLLSANESAPYAMTRRTGVAVDPNKPREPIFLDARDVTAPYTPGSLRGGTHGHCWSADGHMLSYTYNDEIVEPDLRTVGVLIPSDSTVRVDTGKDNNEGCMYAAVVAAVVADPVPGSDEINKAFDECWIGENGYINDQGEHIPHAIAFQGNTLDDKGSVVTEIFIVNVDATKIRQDGRAVGEVGERPHVPVGIEQRRLTRSKGLSDLRYWLRSSRDGRYIYALAKDDENRNQIVQCEVLTGELTFITANPFSIASSFNLSADGTSIAFVADNNVFVFDLMVKETLQVTDNHIGDTKIVGTPSFSPDGTYLVFNQFVAQEDGSQVVQILKAGLQ